MSVSADRLDEGDLRGAAEAARAAEAIEPWSAEPQLRLAEIEQAGSNWESARRRAEQAVRSNPDDFRGWVLLSQLNEELDNPIAAVNYGNRATTLAPLVLERATEAPTP
jgi:tetratricopeptide (TPR) repeat protein